MASIEENLSSIAESLRELVKLAGNKAAPTQPAPAEKVAEEKPAAKKTSKAAEKPAPTPEPEKTGDAFGGEDEPVYSEADVRKTLQELATVKGTTFAQDLLKEKGKMDSPVLKNLSKDRYAAVIAAAKVHLG